MPYAIDNLSSPAIFTEIKRSQDLGMRAAAAVLDERFEEFDKIFGRKYARVMCDGVEDADTVIVCMGSMSGTVRHVVRQLRSESKKVGIARVVCFRPFPKTELAEALRGVKNVAVIDRVSAMGSFGPLYEEVLASMKMSGNNANAYSFGRRPGRPRHLGADRGECVRQGGRDGRQECSLQGAHLDRSEGR